MNELNKLLKECFKISNKIMTLREKGASINPTERVDLDFQKQLMVIYLEQLDEIIKKELTKLKGKN